MAWYALEALDEALNETKELLFPFDWKLWAKLTILVLFTGGLNMPGGGYTPSDTDTEFEDGTTPMTGMVTAASAIGPRLYVLAAFLVVIVLGLLVVASVFEFVYYQSLLDKKVVLRESFRAHFHNGLQLFGFRLAMILFLLLAIGGVLALGEMFLVLGGGMASSAPQSVLLVIGVVGVLVGGFVLVAAFLGLKLTTEFIPLVMIKNDVGVVQAWKLFYGILKEEWLQVAAYIVIQFIIGLAIGIAVLLAALVLLIPAVPVAIAAILLQLPSAVAFLLFIVGAILFFAVVVYVLQVPAQTFLRYYTISVYRQLTS